MKKCEHEFTTPCHVMVAKTFVAIYQCDLCGMTLPDREPPADTAPSTLPPLDDAALEQRIAILMKRTIVSCIDRRQS